MEEKIIDLGLIELGLSPHGSGYVSTKQLSDISEEIFERELFVQSLEVFEIESESSRPLRVDLSIMGFDDDFEGSAKIDKNFARKVLEKKMEKIDEVQNETSCIFWLDTLE